MNSYTDNGKISAAAAASSLLIGSAVGALVSSAGLALCAAVLVKAGAVPTAAASIIAMAVGAVGAFFAGYSTVSLCRRRGMLMGALSGLMLFLAVVLTGVAAGTSGGAAPLALRCVIYLICGSIGGIVRVNKRVRVR